MGARVKTVKGQNVIVSLFAVDMSPFDLRVVEKRDSAAALAKIQLVSANQALCIRDLISDEGSSAQPPAS